MIVVNGKYYLYRHVRKDTNEVFYVGCATNRKGLYERAYSKKRNNKEWQRIAALCDYDVEILLESDDREFIFRKETEFILLYGRRDLGTGTLVNLTNGGMKGQGKSPDVIRRQLATAKKTGSFDTAIERIRKYSFKPGVNTGYRDEQTYLYDIKGKFIAQFKTRTECAKYVGTFGEQVSRMIRKRTNHKIFIFSDNFCGDTIDLSRYTIRKPKSKIYANY